MGKYSNYAIDNLSGGIVGCTDSNACNYDADATEDDGSCEYAMENYDCDGNCTAGEDCAGECGGSADVDECGVCDGPGAGWACWDGSNVCDAEDCPDEPGDDGGNDGVVGDEPNSLWLEDNGDGTWNVGLIVIIQLVDFSLM